MGQIVSASKIRMRDIEGSNCPIIVVAKNERIMQMISTTYRSLKLNEMLAKRLLVYAQGIRSARALEEANTIVETSLEPIILTNFEMLFTPSYDIDVIRFFLDISRKRKVVIKWCGNVENDTLVYGSEESQDYKRYRVSDYDILCIK